MLLDPPGWHRLWKTGLPYWPYAQAVDQALADRGIPPGIVRADIALRPYHRTDCRDRAYMLLAWDVSRTGARGGVQLRWDDETGWSYGPRSTARRWRFGPPDGGGTRQSGSSRTGPMARSATRSRSTCTAQRR